ncbi:MAG: DUF6273 domain-containing protein [Oscillospiraceae bacterium]|nr:DUF6273 domain-containing protein [Oscillospiraceae bacterium]
MSKRIITLGTWDGKPIEWVVIREESFAILVVSKNILMNMCFNQNRGNDRWIDSFIRKELNKTFFENAFTEDEKKKIVSTYNNDPNATKDNVFCLSATEANYMTVKERQSDNTWWLRTPHSGNEAKNVDTLGTITYQGYVDSSYGIRPAMWIKE